MATASASSPSGSASITSTPKASPLLYVTAATPTATSASGTPVTGAFASANRNGAPNQVLGAGGLEHQTVDNAKLKLSYDLTPTISAAYTLGFFQNNDDAGCRPISRAPGRQSMRAR